MGRLLGLMDAKKILREMHFSARVIRSGRRRGVKSIWWTTLEEGVNTYTNFSRDVTWEAVIEYARKQLPVWDKALLFIPGDIIEFDDWELKGRRLRAVVCELRSHDMYVVHISPSVDWRVRCELGNYALNFHMNAVKIGELEF